MSWKLLKYEKPIVGQYVIGTDGHHVGECITAPNDDFIVLNTWTVEPWRKVIAWMPLPKPPECDVSILKSKYDPEEESRLEDIHFPQEECKTDLQGES